jgi:CubicO group peptidase (beta-lactamase class C family)
MFFFSTSPLSRRTLLQSVGAGSLALAMPNALIAADDNKLKRRSPEALGVDPAAVSAFVDAVEAKVGGLHSFMLLRKGQVAAEAWWAPYTPEHPHLLYSLSKSFTSTAVGFAVSEGKLKVDDLVTSFFPNDLPATLGDNLKEMRVRHLLSMSTGHDKDATGPTVGASDGNWPKAFLALPVEHAPGSKFVYNSAATYMCSNIVQKLTGKTVLDYLTPRLFQPLGIEGMTWETDPRGVNTGGWGLKVKTEDIARFGQCYLQKGMWNGKQVVPEAWVADATSKHIENGTSPTSDWNQGYGYQFWRCRHNAFRGDGAFGQYCVVMPEQDAVLAITSGLGDMQAVLNAVWDHLLPGIGSDAKGEDGALRRKLKALNVHTPTGKPTSPVAAQVSGKTYKLDANPEKVETISFTFRDNDCTIGIGVDGQKIERRSSTAEWVKGVAHLTLAGLFPATTEEAAGTKGAWTDDSTYVITIAFVETPYVESITCKFAGDAVTVNRKLNVGFGPTDSPVLTGKA